MQKQKDPNNPGLKPGDLIQGYRLQRSVQLESIDSIYYDLEHPATKTRHIHISNKDAENTFSVAFKTVPADSTGVAHILEHTALCGSQKYPVRDPFFSMLKRSLSTFMNAFTASDWTMYPFSTQNRKDFYNLLDVYLDAAFFPRLDLLNFKQEGHRLEIEGDPGAAEDFRLVYKGVVYNEMKGAMSSPQEVMVRSMLNALYPETTYRFNSGGDPKVITLLTHEQLKAFHARHYHPSNAYFYSYGNLPLEAHLEFIQEKILNHFKGMDPKTDVPPQPRWHEPRAATYYYPLGKNEDPAQKCQISMAWLTADIKDAFEVLALTLLEQILLGNAASPLRKALIDSGLGSALSDGTGFDADNRDTLFAAGLKDTKEGDADRIEKIILGCLIRLADDGIDKSLIESAIHQLEFHRKEITNQPYPYGIKLLLSFSGCWLHGGDPVRALKFDADIERIREQAAREAFFEDRIRRYFLKNPHRVLLTLLPDQQMGEREEKRIAAELAQIKADMTRSDLDQIVTDAEALKKLQETHEDLSVLPTLEKDDIPPDVKCIRESTSPMPLPATTYLQPTAGIFYFTAAIGTGALESDLFPWVPFFCHAFSRVGTALRPYTDMVRIIDAYTGGISLSANARTEYESEGKCLSFINFNAKCLVRNQKKMFEIAAELLGSFDFKDRDRIKNLLLEYRAGLEAMVVRNGHRLAMSLASRNFSPALALEETWHGIHQLTMIKKITDGLVDERLDAVSNDLSAIANYILTAENIKAALIGEDAALSAAADDVHALFGEMKSGGTSGFEPPRIGMDVGIPCEGWATTSTVSFVARAFQTVSLPHEDAPALAVISKMLRSLYLHREIREKGGAYGGFALYNPENGLFSLGSYRDPHIAATLSVYDGVADFIRAGSYTDEDIKEATLQVCADIDRPDPPGPAARKAFYRKILSLTDEARHQYKQAILALTRDRVIQVAEKYFYDADRPQAIAVISGDAQLEAANRALKDRPLKIYAI